MPSASWSATSASTATNTNRTSKSYGLFYTPDEGRSASRSARRGDGEDVNEALKFSRLSLGGQNGRGNGIDTGLARARRAKRRFVAASLKEGVEKQGIKVTTVG